MRNKRPRRPSKDSLPGTTCRKTHDLAALGRLCAEIDRPLATPERRAARLTEYAWKYRYPGEPEEPPREEAESALAIAGEVYQAVPHGDSASTETRPH
jgi:hypothetical protein